MYKWITGDSVFQYSNGYYICPEDVGFLPRSTPGARQVLLRCTDPLLRRLAQEPLPAKVEPVEPGWSTGDASFIVSPGKNGGGIKLNYEK